MNKNNAKKATIIKSLNELTNAAVCFVIETSPKTYISSLGI